jgi:hypothetical protein
MPRTTRSNAPSDIRATAVICLQRSGNPSSVQLAEWSTDAADSACVVRIGMDRDPTRIVTVGEVQILVLLERS